MMVKRNLIRILIAAEIMGNGVNIALVALAVYGRDLQDNPIFSYTPQGLIMLIISVAAAHTALALVLMLMYNRRYGTVDLSIPVQEEVS